MPVLVELTGKIRALRNMKDVRARGMPRLSKCTLLSAFKCVAHVEIENAGKLEEVKVLKEAKLKQMEELLEWENSIDVITRKNNWNAIDWRIGVILVSDECCSEEAFVLLDLTRFVNLRELEIGCGCFQFVQRTRIVGLKKLEKVVVGENSFTRKEANVGRIHNLHHEFCLKECEELKELRVGDGSFMQYSVCEIEDVPLLEVLEIGSGKENAAGCFGFAGLVLKGGGGREELWIDMPKLRSLVVGDCCFCQGDECVLESAC